MAVLHVPKKRGSKRRSDTLTIRLHSPIRDRLENEAKNRHLSLNAYIEEALERTVDWGIFQQQFEYVTVTKELLETLLHEAADADITRTKDNTVARLKDFATLVHGKPDLEGLLSVLELGAKYQYPLAVACSIRRDREGVHVFLRHGISRKWSVYLGEACLAYLRDINLQASYEAMETSVNLDIPNIAPKGKT